MDSTSTPTNTDSSMPDHEECMRLLQVVLDEEATHEEQEIFEKHVCNCMPYYEIYEVDKTIKQMLKQNCIHDVPEGMANEIRLKLFQKSN